MTKDKRIKCCFNEECDRFVYKGKKRKKPYTYKATEDYCSLCGRRLVLVCAKCYREIDDKEGPDHWLCLRCEAKRDDRLKELKEKTTVVKNGAKHAGVAAKDAAMSIRKKAAGVTNAVAEKTTDVVGKEEIQNAFTKVVNSETVQKVAKEVADDAKKVLAEKADELADVAADAIKTKIRK